MHLSTRKGSFYKKRIFLQEKDICKMLASKFCFWLKGRGCWRDTLWSNHFHSSISKLVHNDSLIIYLYFYFNCRLGTLIQVVLHGHHIDAKLNVGGPFWYKASWLFSWDFLTCVFIIGNRIEVSKKFHICPTNYSCLLSCHHCLEFTVVIKSIQ